MAIVIEPYIPETITVHLGPPDAPAENVTVSFPDYVKNVASSEIYPTWEPAAIRANVLAIISFALNRVYTEFYPSRGYDFQITSSTAYDQKFIRGRNFFDSISRVVDDIFDNYLRREGVLEPLAAKFCNGTTVTCDGLSQWGSQEMAQLATVPTSVEKRLRISPVEYRDKAIKSVAKISSKTLACTSLCIPMASLAEKREVKLRNPMAAAALTTVRMQYARRG